MKQLDGIKFKFGEVAGIIDFDDKISIRGKIKGIDCYVVSIPPDASGYKIRSLNNKFGLPNRHLELDWGKFSGFRTEFVVPFHFIIKVK